MLNFGVQNYLIFVFPLYTIPTFESIVIKQPGFIIDDAFCALYIIGIFLDHILVLH